MSFQDMGKKKSRGTTTTTAQGGFSARPAAPSSAGGNGLSQISENLNQYQRNVGILEKIVQQLGVARKQGVGGGTLKELVLQYNVQVDVVTQLEGRVKQQIGSAQSGAPQIVKLKRDFERVQARVQSLKLDVDRMERLAAKSTSMTSTNAMTATGGGGGLTSNYSSTESYAEVAAHNTGAQQQMQLQMQHDRLAEEIMREREAEIRNINKGMHQVNEIYKDLAHIVGSQQENVDAIESQTEESKANAEQGLKQIEKANEKYGNGQCVIS